MITKHDKDSSATKYAEDIIESYKLCSDVSDEFIRGVEESVEEAFLAGIEWAMKQASEKEGELTNPLNRDFSKASRELKLKYQDLKTSVNNEFNQRQAKVSINIERLRNERSYYIAKLRLCEDIEESRSRIDELSDDIARYHMEKVELDRARKESINALKRRQNKEIDALETEYSKRGGGQ